MGQINPQIAAVTQRIIERSASLRAAYLQQIAFRAILFLLLFIF